MRERRWRVPLLLPVILLACGTGSPATRPTPGSGDDAGERSGTLADAGDPTESGLDSGEVGAGSEDEAGPAQPDGGAAASALLPVRLRCELEDAPLAIPTATPRLSWELQSPDAASRGQSQTAFEVLVASSPALLAADQGDLFSSGMVTSDDMKLVYAGRALRSLATITWKVRVRDQAARLSAWSAPSECTVGLLGKSDWGAAQWITGGAAGALPIFRREFSVAKAVARALVSVCGLGQFEMRLNGTNVSDAVMEPSWTNYSKVCQYATYDVTRLLASGQNAIGVLLGNGMYNVPATPGRYTKFTSSFGAPKLVARLDLAFTDGTNDAIVTDSASWKTAAGPITFTNIFGGEDFDARAEPPGWDRAGFSDAAWAQPTTVSSVPPSLVARYAPPVKVIQQFKAQKVTQPQPGVFVYDLGQNFAGWPELTVQGAAGATVKLTPGELLDGQGLVTQSSMGGGPISFSYTLSGAGSEVWHPRFAYTGFRYLRVDGAVPMDQAAIFPGRPEVASLVGQFISSSAESVGQFSSSDADLNRIHALILAAFRSNLQSVLTDCPQREKLGWQEQSHLLAQGIMYNFDVATLYEKILRDVDDAQTAAGLVPDIAPEYPVFAGGFRDSPEWGSAFVINPWQVYLMYGDSQPMVEHYAKMKGYIAYLSGRASQNILGYGLGDWYDIGPNPPGVSQLTSSGVTATAIWLQDLQIMEGAATLLGNSADVAQFQSTIAAVTGAFNARFLSPAGYYDRNSQTADAMPLALGLVPDAQRPAVLASLVAATTGAHNRVTAGDIGFLYVVRALSDAGRSDVVLSLMKQPTGPGYLYQLAHGATSLTEAWDSNPTSSQNHAMLGHAEEWFYAGLGGIKADPSAPGWKRFAVAPQPQAGIDSVDVQYHSVRGNVASHWQRSGSGIGYSIIVPVNATATVTIPTSSPAGVTESGAPAATAPGVTSHTEQAGALVLEVGSGQYSFSAP